MWEDGISSEMAPAEVEASVLSDDLVETAEVEAEPRRPELDRRPLRARVEPVGTVSLDGL